MGTAIWELGVGRNRPNDGGDGQPGEGRKYVAMGRSNAG